MGFRDRRDDALRLVFVRRWPPIAIVSACLFFLLPACTDTTEATSVAGKSLPGKLRIVTLAPHLAELVYAAGAGETLVGVSAYSNYPPAVKALPHIGDAFLIDQEQLLLLQPDILLAWESGTAVRTVDKLRRRGYRVEVIRTNGLKDIADALKTIGHLTGHSAEADSAAAEFLADIDQLRVADAQNETLRVFYQISSRPLYTVNGDHYVSELIALCGGANIFSDLGALAPLVSEEAVLVRDPELMIAGRFADGDELLDDWRRWPALTASVLDNFFYVPMDLLARPTPRLAEAGTIICEILEEARQNRQPT